MCPRQADGLDDGALRTLQAMIFCGPDEAYPIASISEVVEVLQYSCSICRLAHCGVFLATPFLSTMCTIAPELEGLQPRINDEY